MNDKASMQIDTDNHRQVFHELMKRPEAEYRQIFSEFGYECPEEELKEDWGVSFYIGAFKEIIDGGRVREVVERIEEEQT